MANSTTTTASFNNQDFSIREPQNAQELVNLVNIYFILKLHVFSFAIGTKYYRANSR